MGCFSTIEIDHELLPEQYKHVWWQTKDLPYDEEKEFPCDDCYDGVIRRDGRFVREDGMWNPGLGMGLADRITRGPPALAQCKA